MIFYLLEQRSFLLDLKIQISFKGFNRGINSQSRTFGIGLREMVFLRSKMSQKGESLKFQMDSTKEKRRFSFPEGY